MDQNAPRPAATLLLVRESAQGPEVFMVRRPGAADFGGMYVFPGGKVDASDASLGDLCVDLDDTIASQRLGLDAGGLAYWVAAIRESFEEAGALLAYRSGAPVGFADETLRQRFDIYRHQMQAGALSLLELCQREALEIATDRVHYFSHWITPKNVGRRYDTRFFLAPMPADQVVNHHAEELTDSCWVRPADALAHHEDKRWQMIYPTLMTLRTLAEYRSIDGLIDAVRNWAHHPEVTATHNQQGMQPLPR